MSEEFPDQPPAQAPARRAYSDVKPQSATGLPSESVGVRRPPRHWGKTSRNAVPVVIGLALGIVYVTVSSLQWLFILGYVALSVYFVVRLIAHRVRRRRFRRWR
jgi:hypothetical protein